MRLVGFLWVGVGVALVVVGAYASSKAPAVGVVLGLVAVFITVGGLDILANGEG